MNRRVGFSFVVLLLCLVAFPMPTMADDFDCADGRCIKNAVSAVASVATYPVRVLDGLNDLDRTSQRCDQYVQSVVPFVVSGQPSIGYVAPCGGDSSPIADTGDLCRESRIVQTYQRGYRVLSKRELQMLCKLRKTKRCR